MGFDLVLLSLRSSSTMVKGFKDLILLEAAAKRKVTSCRKKLKELERGLSPSDEDSSLESWDNIETAKKEPKETFFCTECGEGGIPEFGKKCANCDGKEVVVKQEAKEEEAVPGGGYGGPSGGGRLARPREGRGRSAAHAER